MSRTRQILRPLLIVFALAAPALIQNAASHFTDNPYLRPLGITAEDIARSGEKLGDGPWIDVKVAWGRDFAGPLTRDALRETITRAIAYRTNRYYVAFDERPGARVDVTFEVGRNHFGPFPPGGMAQGIELAFSAFDMVEAESGWDGAAY